MRRALATTVGVLALAGASLEAAELRPGRPIAASRPADAEDWSHRVDALEAAGTLRIASVQADEQFPGRTHVRYDQRQGGVRVFGAQIVRQRDAGGRTLSVFGRMVEGLDLETTPALTAGAAAEAAEGHVGPGARAAGPVELVVLPLADRAVLAYTLWVRRGPALSRCFVDARSGGVVLAFDDRHTQAAVGAGTGVWGDRKKVSATRAAAEYQAEDRLRPAQVLTYDMRFDLGAANLFLQSGVISEGFVARDADNSWTDGGVVDAHVYAGWTYDYYFKRHGRRGIDGIDGLPIRSVTHFLPREAGFIGAFWDPRVNTAFYGDGDGFYEVFSAALDVVAHELTHGVTQYTWDGIYLDESGALNEAFSDIMGASVEFYFEPAGNGRQRAEYFLGEDLSQLFDPATYAFRSLENPGLFCNSVTGCDPDNYARRYRGPADNGGVHINSGIANQAFYLLVEGGTNRTSGRFVEGLGGGSRERAEAIFYRGFTAFLTPSATFADARQATLQAARELYGVGSREEQQVAAAWSAVGVD